MAYSTAEMEKSKRIFVCAHSDLFHENVPTEWIDHIFGIMMAAPQHTFQVLSKRPKRAMEYLADTSEVRAEGRAHAPGIVDAQKRKVYMDTANGLVPPNIWLGTSVEDQATAEERIPYLLGAPAAKRFISCEPLLGPVELYDHPHHLDWVIVGGESGQNARPMDVDWARSLRDQCRDASTSSFFFKQMSKKAPIPNDLMIREFPDG